MDWNFGKKMACDYFISKCKCTGRYGFPVVTSFRDYLREICVVNYLVYMNILYIFVDIWIICPDFKGYYIIHPDDYLLATYKELNILVSFWRAIMKSIKCLFILEWHFWDPMPFAVWKL